MWKKIGSIGSGSNDDISSRSRDQNAYQPFSQMSKMRINESQFFPNTNQVFGTNFLSKRKNNANKWGSQSMLKINPQLYDSQSFQQIDDDNVITNIKKKALNKQQASNQYKLKSSLKLIIDSSTSQNNINSKIYEDKILLPDTQSTEIICSDNSIQQDAIRLHHCRSTPQFNLVKCDSIESENIYDRKISAKNKLKSLKEQHVELKKDIQSQLKQYKKSLLNMQSQMMTQLQSFLEKFTQNKIVSDMKQINQNQNSSNSNKILPKKQQFTDKINNLSKKKNEKINKLNSIKQKR